MEIKAKDMVLDFFHYIFLIVISIIFFFYFFLGDRMELAQKIVRSFMFLSIFGVLFIIKSKMNDREKKKLIREQRLEEIINYLTKKDKFKDLIVISVLPILLYGIALINGYILSSDIFQTVAVFFIGLSGHVFLFRKRDDRALTYVRHFDIIIDSVVVFSLPIAVLALSFIDGGADIIDIAQAGSVFIVMYYWHKYLFRRKEK
ncbi:hypothetical protein K8R32_01425 [bacterium]|nr:hypothetical protein [bacterium]